MKRCDCSRRDALITIGLGALAASLPGCSAKSTLSPASATHCTGGYCIDLTVAANAALRTVGGGVLLDTGSDRIAVVRQSATRVVALSAVCTHEGCLTDLDASASTLDCPCHGSSFALTGAVVQGPAFLPLRVYGVTLAGDIVTVMA